MLENILLTVTDMPENDLLFRGKSENHSVTSFKIKVAHALKLTQRSTCSTRKKIHHAILHLIIKSASYASALT